MTLRCRRMAGLALVGVWLSLQVRANAQVFAPVPLLPEPVVAALAHELSGENAKRIVQELTLLHRMRGSRAFRRAAETMSAMAESYQLSDVQILKFPADGKIFYGTQRSRPAWDAEFAELWELQDVGGRSVRTERIASWNERPVTLAQDSASGTATADLVDVGPGTTPSDYEGKDVRGKLVLVSAQPGAAAALAVDRFGAVGIVSYAQNQPTAWSRDDDTLVRWGHLDTFPEPRTFAFMVSLRQAREWQERLHRGQRVRLDAVVRAGQSPGSYDIATGVLRGADPQVRDEEIVVSCHLDHQRPGANDNASGCATISEIARALAALVRDGRIPPPRRSIRFVWPPEIEGTTTLLNARPEIAARVKAAVHLDMVGGGPATKAIFHVTKAPKSLPTFVNDVAEAFGRFVNAESDLFASGEGGRYPLVAPEGGKEPLLATLADFSLGSDHEVYADSAFRVPAVYLNDWPDRYIHTSNDTVANIDPTKLLRAGFIAAASAYYLARFHDEDVAALWPVVERGAVERAAAALARSAQVNAAGAAGDASAPLRFQLAYERQVLESIGRFAVVPESIKARARTFHGRLEALLTPDGAGVGTAASPAGSALSAVYRRTAAPKGPMAVFSFDYLEARLRELRASEPRLPAFQGLWGGGADYAYETLNLIDGRRSLQQVRDDVTAIYGPVPVELVVEFVKALEQAGVVEVVRP